VPLVQDKPYTDCPECRRRETPAINHLGKAAWDIPSPGINRQSVNMTIYIPPVPNFIMRGVPPQTSPQPRIQRPLNIGGKLTIHEL
jgi:hypothetical protein